jgi:hypothetical protein
LFQRRTGCADQKYYQYFAAPPIHTQAPDESEFMLRGNAIWKAERGNILSSHAVDHMFNDIKHAA